MSFGSTARALPTMLRVGIAEAVAYRAELLVWVLATTMPLVMLALWTAVARDAPIGRFGEQEFVGYFLCTFIVRQLVGSWAAWQINFEIKDGTLALRLMRPISPLVNYAIENIASIPLRSVVAIPVAIVLLFAVGTDAVTHDPLLWMVSVASLLGAWLITLLVSFIVGSLAFYLESSNRIMDIWNSLFFVLSGYLLPVELFPSRFRPVIDALPFRYQIGFPVEVVTHQHDLAHALGLLGVQWSWVLALGIVTHFSWSRGVRRFSAFGG